MSEELHDNGTAPLDLVIPTGGGIQSRETRRRSTPSVAFGICPQHTSGDKPTGLIRQGQHLVWRLHDVVTWSGARHPCHASGTPVCEQPPARGQVRCRCSR